MFPQHCETASISILFSKTRSLNFLGPQSTQPQNLENVVRKPGGMLGLTGLQPCETKDVCCFCLSSASLSLGLLDLCPIKTLPEEKQQRVRGSPRSSCEKCPTEAISRMNYSFWLIESVHGSRTGVEEVMAGVLCGGTSTHLSRPGSRIRCGKGLGIIRTTLSDLLPPAGSHLG